MADVVPIICGTSQFSMTLVLNNDIFVEFPTKLVMPSIVSYEWSTLQTQRLGMTLRLSIYLLIKREQENLAGIGMCTFLIQFLHSIDFN